ncbi:MAG: peroxiredoxin [Opitutaceae bacterium]|nr:peroxiredoxin [Opitutaceae bacterium]
MKLRFLGSLSLFLSTLLAACGAGGNPLKVGDPAPSVTALDDRGETVNLAEVYAQNGYTLVYFYPKAGTPGCTAQGCALRDAYEELTDRGVAVVGVSTDTVEEQRAFKAAQNFPFTLLADTDKKVLQAFGVPTYPGTSAAKRQAFLIKGGKVVWVDYSASTGEQAADVLKFIATP